MDFDWDTAKNDANEQKHGLRFEHAISIFRDPRTIVFPANSIPGGETRRLALGYLDGVLHVVIFTERPPLTRIISARKASRDERRQYRQSTT